MVKTELKKNDLDFKKIFNMDDIVKKAWSRYKFTLDSKIQENLSGDILHKRTGQLSRTVAWGELQRKKDLSYKVTLKTPLPYASIHDEGGIIRPKKKKFLTVPLPAALTPAGVLRGKATSFKNTFIDKTDDGDLIIFQNKNKGEGKEDEIIPLFVLKKKVEIPARKWFSSAVDDTADVFFAML